MLNGVTRVQLSKPRIWEILQGHVVQVLKPINGIKKKKEISVID